MLKGNLTWSLTSRWSLPPFWHHLEGLRGRKGLMLRTNCYDDRNSAVAVAGMWIPLIVPPRRSSPPLRLLLNRMLPLMHPLMHPQMHPQAVSTLGRLTRMLHLWLLGQCHHQRAYNQRSPLLSCVGFCRTLKWAKPCNMWNFASCTSLLWLVASSGSFRFGLSPESWPMAKGLWLTKGLQYDKHKIYGN